MKKLFLMFTALAFTMNAFAEDFSLYYESTQGGNKEISAVTNLQKMTFTDGKLTVTFKDGTVKFTNLSEVKRLFFATSTTGVEQVEVPQQSVNDSEAVYDLLGRKVSETFGDNLTKGMYIVGGNKVLVK
jgi:hypothetical protein